MPSKTTPSTTAPDAFTAFRDELVAHYTRVGASAGHADLLAGRSGDVHQRAGTIALLLLSGRKDDGTPAIARVVITVAPDEDETAVLTQVRAGMFRTIGDGVDEPHATAHVEGSMSRLAVHRTSTLDTQELLNVLRDLPVDAALVVTRGAEYRAAAVPARAERADTEAEVWAPHVRHVLAEALPPATNGHAYLFIDVGLDLPHSGVARDMLMAFDACGVFAPEAPELPIVTGSMLARWDAMSKAGELGAALQEIDTVGEDSPGVSALLRVRLFAAAGFEVEAVALVKTLVSDPADLTHGQILQLARYAGQLGEEAIALRLLTDTVPSVVQRELLELAMAVAEETGHRATLAAVEARLGLLHPASHLLRGRRVDEEVEALLAARRYRDAAAVLRACNNPDASEAASLWELVADHLQPDERIDADSLIAAVSALYPERIDEMRRVAARLLERAGNRLAAIALLIPTAADAPPPSTETCIAALYTLERGRLAGDAAIDDEAVRIIVWHAIQRLALEPNAFKLQLRLSRVLQPQVLATTAMAVMAWCILAIANRPVRVVEGHRTPGGSSDAHVSPEALMPVMARGLEWLAQERTVIIGQRQFPAALLDASADETIKALTKLLAHQCEHIVDADDERSARLSLTLGVAMAPLGSDPDADLELVRTACTRLAMVGHAQLARDLTQHVLHTAGDDPRRRRLAWFVYADVYARLGAHTEAMIAAAAALAADDRVTWEQTWYDTTLLFRIFRSVGLSDFAQPFLDGARRALAHIRGAEHGALRLEAMQLQVRFASLVHSRSSDSSAVEQFLADVVAQVRVVMASGDEIAPIVALLAEAVHLCHVNAVTVPAEVRTALRDALPTVSPLLRERIELASMQAAPVERIVEVTRRAFDARDVSDLGFDLKFTASLAHRLFESSDVLEPVIAAYATESTADHTILAPGERGTDAYLLLGADGPLKTAVSMSANGLAVVLLGMGGGAITRLALVDGAVHECMREPSEVFEGANLNEWRRDFPYAYATADAHVFFTSTMGLGVSVMPTRSVIVASTWLQSLPPNLLNVGEELAGTNHALALAPSLTWLSAAQSEPFASNGRRVAWIPTAEPEGGSPTLAMLADRLQTDLKTHSVAAVHTERPPTDLAGCELVVVAAHGGVAMDNRYFLGVQDDTAMALGSSAVARALGGVGVVVLFVCSGGRMDVHPEASAVLGLVNQLLAKGCRAVIAPPWPLETSVPPHWLPAFLAAWNEGHPVIDACFVANAAVRKVLGDNPRHYLAMTLYGDPLITVAPRQGE
jgi:CHAT domain